MQSEGSTRVTTQQPLQRASNRSFSAPAARSATTPPFIMLTLFVPTRCLASRAGPNCVSACVASSAKLATAGSVRQTTFPVARILAGCSLPPGGVVVGAGGLHKCSGALAARLAVHARAGWNVLP